MSAPKWTPGPWELSWTERDHGQKKGQKILSHIFVPIPGQRYGSKSMVLFPHYEMSDGDVWQSWVQVKEANAHLIAAAPDLAEALENLLLRADAMGWGDDELAPARAALAKARGEDP